MKIGYVGLGIMGRPCVENLLNHNWPVSVWARRPEACLPLEAKGATVANSFADLVQSVDVLICNVSDTPDVEALMLGEAGVEGLGRAGLICVDMSTISPLRSQVIAQRLAIKKIDFLDCPVSGGEVGAIQGTLTIMVGGQEAALETVRPVLASMGKTITHIGESGAGQVAKACNQILVGGGIALVAEVMQLASACGVDRQSVKNALMGGFGQSRVLDLHGQRMIDDNYQPGFKAGLHLKDMNIVLSTAKEIGLDLKAATRVQQLIQSQVDHGEAELDSAGIAKRIWNGE